MSTKICGYIRRWRLKFLIHPILKCQKNGYVQRIRFATSTYITISLFRHFSTHMAYLTFLGHLYTHDIRYCLREYQNKLKISCNHKQHRKTTLWNQGWSRSSNKYPKITYPNNSIWRHKDSTHNKKTSYNVWQANHTIHITKFKNTHKLQ